MGPFYFTYSSHSPHWGKGCAAVDHLVLSTMMIGALPMPLCYSVLGPLVFVKMMGQSVFLCFWLPADGFGMVRVVAVQSHVLLQQVKHQGQIQVHNIG